MKKYGKSKEFYMNFMQIKEDAKFQNRGGTSLGLGSKARAKF